MKIRSLIAISLFIMIHPALAQMKEIIKNGEFNDDKRYWTLKQYHSASMTYFFPSDSRLSGEKSLAVQIATGGALSDIEIYQSILLETGRIYSFGLLAKSQTPCSLQILIEKTGSAAYVLWESPVLEIGTEKTRIGNLEYRNFDPDGSYRFKILMGGTDNVTLNLDSISVIMRDNPDHLRDDENYESGHHAFKGTNLPYRFYKPLNIDPEKKYPLVVALHGAAERGTDNKIHIERYRFCYSWSDSANQAKWPCFIVAPQCPNDNKWVDVAWELGGYRIAEIPVSNETETVIDLLDSLLAAYPIDRNRVFAQGLSMGGYGSWDIVTRYPQYFAALVTMGGGGDSSAVRNFGNLPIWVFHGEKDDTVPLSGSRDMITALENAGRKAVFTHCNRGDCDGMTVEEIQSEIDSGADLLYTEWPNAGHVIFAESYDYPLLFPWVFSQTRESASSVGQIDPSCSNYLVLHPNYPNPFNASTVIRYSLPTAGRARLTIYNLAGQQISTLADGLYPAGSYSIEWNAADCTSGLYLYRLETAGAVMTKKLVLQK
ncbi:MAG: T9SS C-terminal target domain-containing protein [Calditrichaeota bacterium]|nr:MAG: T9SS C-terminal target domain-containing protein [Calditrichota bacterium]